MLKPFIRLLNRMKYARKFTIIGCILLLPLLVASLLYGSTIQEEKDLIEKRLEGAEYNIVLTDIFQYTLQSSGLKVLQLAGDDSVKGQLDETVSMVNEAFEKIEEMEAEMKNDFQTKDQVKAIQNKWEALLQTNSGKTLDILTQYDELLKDIMNLMANVANDSELLLAQSKEMFNLIYISSIELPALTEQLGLMRSYGLAIISNETSDPVLNRQMEAAYLPMLTDIDALVKSAEKIFSNKEFEKALQPYTEAVNTKIDTYLSTMESIGSVPVTSKQYYDVATDCINAFFDLYTASLDVVDSTLLDQYNNAQQVRFIMYTSLCVVFVLATVFFISLFLSIRQAIQLLVEGTTKVANGDLNVQLALNTKDEMSQVETAFNSMTVQLKELVEEITDSAQYVAASSEELNASAQEATASVEHVTSSVNDMMSKTNIQEESLQEGSQAMDEMVSAIERIAENCVRISSLTNETTDFAYEGNETVEKSLQQMNMIKQTVAQSSEKINELYKQSAEIDSILNVITAIADQTNLLALNAAIEAARAGEQGKGFAVVADEVRKLAEESRNSAAKIAELIRSIQIETTNSVQMMSNVTDNVEDGIKVTEETAYKFNRIVSSMQTLNPQMVEISTTATEFTTQAEQVAAAMQNLLLMARETAETSQSIATSSEEQLAIMQEVSTAANTLSETADSLQNLTAKFNI